MEWPYKHFSEKEMACSHCGVMHMEPEFMWKLEALRQELGVIMFTHSGFRCDEFEKQIGGSGANHPKGMAWDGQIKALSVGAVIRAAIGMGFTGIGIKAHGPKEGRYIHLDTVHDSLTVWTYA